MMQWTSVRACDVVCPLDTAAVTELWRLDLFSCTSSTFLCAGTLVRETNVAVFCGRFSHRWPKRNMRVCMGKIEFET